MQISDVVWAWSNKGGKIYANWGVYVLFKGVGQSWAPAAPPPQHFIVKDLKHTAKSKELYSVCLCTYYLDSPINIRLAFPIAM